MTPDFQKRASRYQKELDAFLLESKGAAYEFNDPTFRFRYASGGALPVLRFGREEYYCLFYRDIFPIGWNIANGGCDNKNELLNPSDTVERELREELIIIDPRREKRYVFEGDAGKPLDHYDFAVARRLWQERFPSLDFPRFKELVIPLKWLNGPDYLTVKYADESPRTITGHFLNINAEDFGMEIDKIAKVSLDEDVVLLSGEIVGNHLHNGPIGLFDVDRLNQQVREGQTDFIPDRFFYEARLCDGKDLQRVISDKFLPYINLFRSPEEKEWYETSKNRFDLCPVTRRIIERYLRLHIKAARFTPGPFEVFISFGKDDRDIARRVFKYLKSKNMRVFFSEETISHPDFLRVIDAALDSARCLIGVATKPDNLETPWVGYESRSFHNDILNGRKPSAKVISFISGFKPVDLPRPFRSYEAITYDPDKLEVGIQELIRYIP